MLKKRSVFVVYFLISTVGTVLCLVMGFGLAKGLTDHYFPETKAAGALTVAKILGSVAESSKDDHLLVAALDAFEASQMQDQGEPPAFLPPPPQKPDRASQPILPHYLLIDETGKDLAGRSSFELFQAMKVWDAPQKLYELKQLPENPNHQDSVLIRISKNRRLYLLSNLSERDDNNLRALPIVFTSLLASVLFAALASLAGLIFFLRGYGKSAREVMTQIKNGNLKARFPVNRLDEFSQVMLSFNDMAGEIERLIGRVKSMEQKRLHLIQDLGHDLRTPISSLNLLLGAVIKKGEKMEPEQRLKLVRGSKSEVDYLGRLVDDLLFLALIDEPDDLKAQGGQPLLSTIDRIISQIRVSQEIREVKINFQSTLVSEVSLTTSSYILERLFRNAIGNAASFAKTVVGIRVEQTSVMNQVLITIEDDGPGFPTELMTSYGNKRTTRMVEEGLDRRPSLGLGSVIIRKIVDFQKGRLEVSNRLDGEGKPLGAVLKIWLPLKS